MPINPAQAAIAALPGDGGASLSAAYQGMHQCSARTGLSNLIGNDLFTGIIQLSIIIDEVDC
jgi:hypothetical protein